ncbi:class I SAM-dependent methyltransferase [Flexivirga caeni]|uniref:Class I SAM-dependent methyltransferase n=1 Tax=Flexivirga caeni TaxID=2294115 RepID=A0A3M9MIJ4_9MICO|nr:class I SAM-dependent methyltransferase [Flexivirga caeni]RNI25324.1 class I SAM-dependent methyltransferase [Flexivirga caeni]
MIDSNFDEGYLRWRRSDSHAALFGGGMPPEIAPFSFVPLSGMREVGRMLQLRPGDTLVDLGCGRGGPGLWLAAQSGARLIGVDSSTVAIADARSRRTSFANVAADFLVCDVAAAGLPSGSADAVVSIDVLQLVEDPRALVAEAARVLRLGAASSSPRGRGMTMRRPASREACAPCWSPQDCASTSLQDDLPGWSVN